MIEGGSWQTSSGPDTTADHVEGAQRSCLSMTENVSFAKYTSNCHLLDRINEHKTCQRVHRTSLSPHMALYCKVVSARLHAKHEGAGLASSKCSADSMVSTSCISLTVHSHESLLFMRRGTIYTVPRAEND